MTATRERTQRGIEISRNHIGEVFIKDIESGVQMRIDRDPHGGLQFTTSGRVEPVRVNSMIGWRVYFDRR